MAVKYVRPLRTVDSGVPRLLQKQVEIRLERMIPFIVYRSGAARGEGRAELSDRPERRTRIASLGYAGNVGYSGLAPPGAVITGERPKRRRRKS